MRTRGLRKIGELSFGVYLVHIPMVVFFGSHFGYGQWQFCASIVATFAAAAVLSALIERPGIAFGRDLGGWILAGPKVKPDRPIAVERQFDLSRG
jgi:peptidoglycan/LPS O-acetylase OafA/YrhL